MKPRFKNNVWRVGLVVLAALSFVLWLGYVAEKQDKKRLDEINADLAKAAEDAEIARINENFVRLSIQQRLLEVERVRALVLRFENARTHEKIQAAVERKVDLRELHEIRLEVEDMRLRGCAQNARPALLRDMQATIDVAATWIDDAGEFRVAEPPSADRIELEAVLSGCREELAREQVATYGSSQAVSGAGGRP